nr:NF-kappa-B-activating protein, putative isoform 1 [Tanacetum cinerariifolium]
MMAIEKNSFKAVANSRLESEFSRDENMSSEDNEFRRGGVEFDEEGDGFGYDECDSGAASDDFDLLELGETGEEFCQIGDQTCSIPFELYDLSGLDDILSMDVWNDVLTEDERLSLTKYLPDMDQEHFMRTMKELFTGSNFHFGVPVNKLFEMLKGGLCEPRVSLYRQGLGFFQKHKHYHVIRKHQNTMVNNLVQIRDAWSKCRGYSIDEKLRVLNIIKSQKSLMYEKMEELETDSSEVEESADGLWSNKKIKDHKQKWGPGQGQYPGYRSSPALALEPVNFGKQNTKGMLKVAGSNMLEVKPGPSGSSSFLSKQMKDYYRGKEDEGKTMYDVAAHRDHNLAGKKYKGSRGAEFPEAFMGMPVPFKTDLHPPYGRNRTVNQLSDIKVLTAKPSNSRYPYDYGKKLKRPEHNQKIGLQDALMYRDPRGLTPSQIASQQGMYIGGEPYWHNQAHGEPIDLPYRTGSKKNKAASAQNGARIVTAAEGMKMLAKGEETESDSSEQYGDDDDDSNPLMRSKWAYPSGVKSVPSSKKPKHGAKNNNKIVKDLDGSLQNLRKKGKAHGNNFFNEPYTSGPGMFNGGGHMESMFQLPIRKMYPGGKKQKGEYGPRHINDFVGDHVSVGGSANRSQMVEAYGYDHPEMVDARLLGCNSGSKKRKVKDEVIYIDDDPSHDQLDYVKILGKRKWAEESPFVNVIPEAPVIEVQEEEPQKKPFILITPTVHTGFSFSIIHLLSAVRMAMVTQLPEDTMDVAKNPNVNDAGEVKQDADNGDQAVTSCDPSVNPNVPSLTVKDIVNRVRTNPGDPCILETQEPLQDLVRGVLKIFASKTAPLGAKAWKALVLYKKLTKSWSWIGPVSQSSADQEIVEEVTSPDSWGVPHKTLVKLVDSFANWLKSGQETLQQIGSLPAPPAALMQQNYDEKERFRDLRAQKSLNTINPSSEEVREYFRKEEVLRYLIPDRAFAYTAADGKKSCVAPSRRGAGKPTSKARDHFMLKKDRPPHVTILCLVRDAAARLPGSIGTRADVCTLIRDSQYIVEEVSDAQVNQVVSGALDRLHYERDPCVQFDGERKLWVYLHREREEEDFEDDGTSSTKKWKRQKKEPAEASEQGAVALADQVAVPLANQGAVTLADQGAVTLAGQGAVTLADQGAVTSTDQGAVTLADQGTVTLAYQGTGERTGFDLSSDLNIQLSGVHEAIVLDDKLPSQNNLANEALGLDGKLLSQNNSANVSLGLDVKLLSQNNSANEAPGLDVKLLSQNRSVGEALGLDGKLLSQNNSANVTPGLDSKLLFQNNSRNEALRLDDKLPSQDNSANQDIDEVREKVAELLNTSVS